MKKRELRCHGCGKVFEHVAAADIYCPNCSAQDEAAQWLDAHSKLVDAGFAQDPEVQNIYRKDGVAVTIEEVVRDGWDKTSARHADSVRRVSAAAARPEG